ncbi:MAG: flagellar biosynthesis protein FlhF [Treponema sp.]|uniref:flagellar biosynthesis protein FlhF n=1 Tax=Treponema sp. TaxID=166 RepID=UPI003FA253DA
MEIFVEQGTTYDKCIRRITEKYGSDVTILRRKDVKVSHLFGLLNADAVEVTFSVNDKMPKRPSLLSGQQPKTNVKLSDTVPLDEEAERLKIVKRYAEKNPAAASQLQQYVDLLNKKNASGKDTEITLTPEQAQSFEKLVETVNRLAAQVEKQNAAQPDDVHINIAKVQRILEQNDFSPAYIKTLSSRLESELSYTEIENFTVVQKKLLALLADSVKIKPSETGASPRIILLVGPTGVGKTTTLAKIAAQYIGKKSEKPLRVKVITIDNWRIGAAYQMKRYCELMDIPLMVASNPEEVRAYMAIYREEADVICIDTIGRSPNDHEKISSMQEYFNELGDDAEIYLSVCAGTRINDIREIMKQYSVFKYKSLIITKFDETSCIGNLFSIIAETNIPITYITAGQAVPQDLIPADVETFLRKLKGFSVSQDYIDQLCNQDKDRFLDASVV